MSNSYFAKIVLNEVIFLFLDACWDWEKSLKSEKRIISGDENFDTMRFYCGNIQGDMK